MIAHAAFFCMVGVAIWLNKLRCRANRELRTSKFFEAMEKQRADRNHEAYLKMSELALIYQKHSVSQG